MPATAGPAASRLPRQMRPDRKALLAFLNGSIGFCFRGLWLLACGRPNGATLIFCPEAATGPNR